MIWLHATFAVACATCVLAYVCRMDSLRVGQHRLATIVMHVALAGTVFQAMLNAVHQMTDLQDALALAGCSAWIYISAWSWRDGVPEHVVSQVGDLPRDTWADVYGAGDGR